MSVRFSASGQNYTRTLSLGAQSQWTVACWIRLAADRNAFTTAWSLDAGTGDYYLFQAGTDGTTFGLYDESFNSSSPITGSTKALTVGTWYYIAISVNDANGTMVSRAATDTAFTTTTWSGLGDTSTSITTLRIGESAFGSEWLNGNIAGFKFWSGATLTAEEMQSEAWTYTPQRTTNLRAWYPFTRAETTDYSGQGNTLSGGTGATTEDGPPIMWRQGRRRLAPPAGSDASTAPAAVVAPWSIPDPLVSISAGADPAAVVAPWSVPDPDVSITGAPPTLVQPGVVVAPWAVPTPSVQLDVTVFADPVIAAWSVPGPDVIVPINPGDDLDGPGQLSLNGFKMGGGTVYRLTDELAGVDIDMPGLDEGDVPNPSSDGEQSGRPLSQARYITAVFNIRVPRSDIREVMENFRDNTPAPESDEELDLAIQLLDRVYVTRGKVVGRRAIINKNYRLGLAKATLQIKCTDPRLYSKQLGNAVVGDGETVEVTNLGNRKTRPSIRVPGPAVSPHLEIWRRLADGTEDLRTLHFAIEIEAGDTLTIDVTRGTAELSDGTSQTRHLSGSVGLTSFVLGRGVSEISYATAEGDAPPITVLWRHAWL
ncbi:LamG-like jellyroll fold domain-containing protein [Nonomuraea bangladeshensis]|uniref:LamG-like jellyroll fold domain-containing protein n=1 Tax=Nonomuraea bangladeshensis TaxID=404385 RepID=UPI003C2F2664